MSTSAPDFTTFELPVNHIADTGRITEAEIGIRQELAAAYRLCAQFGWDDLIYTHISARVPGAQNHFLVNPLGFGFDEVTASNLVKIDLDGNIVGDSPHRPNAAGFVIHAAIHSSRDDAHCVMHLHTEAGMALSVLDEGLLPLTQHAMRFHERIGYHDYEGIALTMGEQQRIVTDLGHNAALIMRNHGTITVGRSVGHAFTEMFYLEKSARVQLLAQATTRPLRTPDSAVVESTARQWTEDLGVSNDREWPHLVRRLDRTDPSYKD